MKDEAKFKKEPLNFEAAPETMNNDNFDGNYEETGNWRTKSLPRAQPIVGSKPVKPNSSKRITVKEPKNN